MQNTTETNHNLLIIDDDLEIIKTLVSQFKAKYTVFSATSAEEGLSIIQHDKIQVIISAQRIPGMTGVDFFASIKDKYPDIIKVILTAYSEIDTIIKAINDGQVFRYLKKPWNPIELDNILKEAFKKYDLIIQNQFLTANLQKANAELEKKVNLRTKELKQSNDILEESRNRFKLLYDNAPLSYQSLDREACLIDVNKRWLETLGYERDEVIGKFFGNFMTPESAELIKERFPAFVATGSIHDYVFNMVKKNGTIITVSYDGTIIYDKFGSFKQTHCIFQDITQKRILEEKTKESEEKFRTIFEASLVGKSITTLEGKLNLNTSFCNILGYTKEELNNKNWREITHQEDIEQNEKNIQSILKGEVDFTRWEKRYIHKDGHIVWVDIITALKRDEKKNPLYFITEVMDITQGKRIELELKESEYRYRSLANTGQALIWTSGLDKKCNYFNEIWLAFTGRKLEQELGDGWLEGVHPDDLQNCVDIYVDGFNNRKSFSMEYRIRHNSEKYRWIQDDGSPRYDSNGEFLGFIGHCLDITERKHTEEELIKAQTIAHLGSWHIDLATDEVHWTEELYRIYGLDPTLPAPSFNDPRELFTPESLTILQSSIAKTKDEGTPFELVLNTVKKDGTNGWIWISGEAIRDSKARITGLRGTAQDVTQRKIVEKTLIESEAKLSALFSGMTEMVVFHELVFDTFNNVINYRIIDCNDTFTKVSGVLKENAIGKLATEVYNTEKAPFLEEYANVCITGEKTHFQSYFQPMDKHFIVSAISLGNNQFSTVTTDITEIQQSKEAIIRSNKELENYIYVASHDLRSPLVNIQGFSQRLQKQTLELQRITEKSKLEENDQLGIAKIVSEDMPKSLNFVQTNVTKMDRLINGLLQVSRTGRMSINPKQVDMYALISSIIGNYNFQLTEINAEVKIDQLISCYGDENLINQLFSNLISNAIKYRSVERKFKLEISSESHYNKVIYSIHDNGIGIHQKYHEKMWDVFFRVDSTNDEGDGVGLSIVKSIVDKHNGKIWLESEEGLGSIFYIELLKDKFEI